MRHFLLILLIALFPLRGFAGVGMQTHMGVMALHHAAMVAEPASRMAQADNATAAEPIAACCSQCNVCDLCHLLVGQPPVSAQVLPLPPGAHAPALAADRFASADRRVAHRPPTSHA